MTGTILSVSRRTAIIALISKKDRVGKAGDVAEALLWNSKDPVECSGNK